MRFGGRDGGSGDGRGRGCGRVGGHEKFMNGVDIRDPNILFTN